jgi:23S rRNA (guanosine2251-2'-O)-methyltransferase
MVPVDGNDNKLLYGLHAVREALRSGRRPLFRLLVVRQDRQFSDIIRMARNAHVPIHVEPRPALDRLVPGGRHQGIIGLVNANRYVQADDILKYAHSRGEPPFVLILDGIEDPQNLGAVLRSAEAAGVHGVFIPERRAVGLTGSVAKASAGAIEYLRIACVQNLSRLIEKLQTEGLWIYALDPQATKPYTEQDLRGPCGLVLGGEGKGIRPGLLEKCDERITIPMRGQVASLNASAAAAIVLFEAVRQRVI